MKQWPRPHWTVRPAALLGTALVLLLAGCGASPTAPAAGAATGPTTATAPSSGPVHGGTLTVAIGADPVNLDPALSAAYSTFEILNNVYNTLVRINAKLQPAPDLATSWTVSKNGLTWTFKLRSGVVFQDGHRFTSADVVYTYDRIMNPATKSGVAYLFAPVKSVAAPNPETVVISLKYPYAPLLSALASGGTAIVNRADVVSGRIATHPDGTGPFSFVRYVPGDHVTLVRNPHYWRQGQPYLNKIVFKIIPDQQVKLTDLQTGHVDWIDSVPPQDVQQLLSSKSIVVRMQASTSYSELGVNVRSKPLSNVLVRQAIAWGISRKAVAVAADYGLAQGVQTPIPPSSPYHYGPTPYHRDPAEAIKLLKEAGYPNGISTSIMATKTYGDTVRAAEVIQSELKKAHINVSITEPEWSTWLTKQGHGDFQMFLAGWIGQIDPDNYFYGQFYTGQVFNFEGYSNPTLDKLLTEGRQALQQSSRVAIYDQVQKILVNDLPYIYLFRTDSVNAWLPTVHGYKILPNSAIRFRETWLSK